MLDIFLDLKELKKFMELPPKFNRYIIRDIKNALVTYAECRAYVSRSLNLYGRDAYKNPDTYLNVNYNILNEKLPKSVTDKLLAALEQMKKENCNETSV